ncbi:MAG: hypothetical protein LBF16_04870 [Pseudomonadales bacterium]|jgi:hypothetical protein|nr:hypothetical protein [Pseudomonadales bacterium]
MTLRNAVSLFFLSATFTAASAAHAGTPIDETHAVNPDAVIAVDLLNGHLKIVGWDRQEFHISGTLSYNATGFTLQERDNGLYFTEELEPRGNCLGNNPCRNNGQNANNNQNANNGQNPNNGQNADLTLEIPRNGILRLRGTNIEVRLSGLERNTEVALVNGTITAEDLKGVVKLNTVNGGIHTHNLEGRLSLETVNGRISDQNSSGNLIDYRTVNGRIESSTQGSHVRLNNVNGKVDLLLGDIDLLEASTMGGDIKIAAALNALAAVDLSSVRGRIELALPAAASADFALRTSVGGHIDNALSSDKPVQRNRFANASNLDFVLNGGGANVKITTLSGDIKLCAASADPVPGC